MSPIGRFCCKSRKLQGNEFFAKTRSENQPLIRIASVALPKSRVSLTGGDEVPHIFTQKPCLQPREFFKRCAKRLLQQNLPLGDIVLVYMPPCAYSSPRQRAPFKTASCLRPADSDISPRSPCIPPPLAAAARRLGNLPTPAKRLVSWQRFP
jgi:hypothetical protein